MTKELLKKLIDFLEFPDFIMMFTGTDAKPQFLTALGQGYTSPEMYKLIINIANNLCFTKEPSLYSYASRSLCLRLYRDKIFIGALIIKWSLNTLRIPNFLESLKALLATEGFTTEAK